MIKLMTAIVWTLGTVAQAWVAYQMCFTVTSIGGYLPMAMFVAPMALAGVLLLTLMARDTP
jgi:hypothetical protein